MTIFLSAWQNAQVNLNFFSTTQDVKHYLLMDHVLGGLAVCANASELVHYHSRLQKYIFITMYALKSKKVESSLKVINLLSFL
jgi:hypothetical protein